MKSYVILFSIRKIDAVIINKEQKTKKTKKTKKMKNFTSLFLAMILTMSLLAQNADTLNVEKVDTITTNVFEDTAIVETAIIDSSSKKMHVNVKGKEILIIQNEDGTTKVNVLQDDDAKTVTLNVDTNVDYFNDDFDSDTTRLRIGKKKIIIIDDGDYENISFHKDIFDDEDGKFKGHFGGIDIGINNYFTSDFTTSLPVSEEYLDLNTGKSWGVNLNLFQQSIGIIKNNVGLVTGLGFEFNNYRFDNKQMVLSGDSTVLYAFNETQKTYQKNKLATTYLTVPLLLEFQIHAGERNKPFFLSVGAVGSIKLGSHLKLKTDGGSREKQRNDYHLSPFRYGVTARIGYDDFAVFANYSLQQMFEKDKGPELYPFTIGVSFLIF
ncbi:MAG: hypothetical protein DRJ01_02585 [Bacteroidetes bacterium]|nr:MAG: hypothetical protein DRJ01_02585 [Bacteroidota bacterium]